MGSDKWQSLIVSISSSSTKTFPSLQIQHVQYGRPQHQFPATFCEMSCHTRKHVFHKKGLCQRFVVETTSTTTLMYAKQIKQIKPSVFSLICLLCGTAFFG